MSGPGAPPLPPSAGWPEPLPTQPWTPPAPTVGTLVEHTLATWRAGWVTFLLVGALSKGAAIALGAAVGSPFVSAGSNPFKPSPEAGAFAWSRGFWVFMAGAMVVSLWSGATITVGAMTALAGGRPRLAEMLSAGLRRLPAVLGAGLLFGLAFYGGLVLLLVPGLLAGVAFLLASTAAAAEPLGPWRALGRSRRLTEGHRWTVLGYSLLLLAIGTAAAFTPMVLAPLSPTLATAVQHAVTAFTGAYYWVAWAVMFHDLRTLKDGAPAAHLHQVFG